jgi:hypothetical protein
MKELVKSLELAINQKNWNAALIMALTLPDIAGNIDYPKDGSQKRYVKWFDKYIKHKYPSTNKVYYGIEGFVLGVKQQHSSKPFMITGEECYAIRCVVLHEGRFKINGQSVLKSLSNGHNVIDKIAESVKFAVDENSSNSDTVNVQFIKKQAILEINVQRFCVDFKDGLYQWLDDIKHNSIKQERLKQTIKISINISI